jgi:uncharacterized iron-regulated protein
MTTIAALAGIALAQTAPPAAPDPNRLPIGLPGTIRVAKGEMRNARTGRIATAKDVAVASRNQKFMLVGESHDNLEHHQMQAAIIEALAADGREVIVGFEMFTRPNQDRLNGWTLGWWSEAEFIEKGGWKEQWGMDFALYRPIFDVVKARRLPMLALNVPRDWVRTASRQGYDALPEEAKKQLPPMDLKQEDHRSVFKALMGGHPLNAQMENVYRGQVLWDEAMADTAIRYLEGRFGSVSGTPSRVVVVIVAGVGHGMYHAGINLRLKNRTGFDTVTMSPTETNDVIEVARGYGDFIYASGVPARSNSR